VTEVSIVIPTYNRAHYLGQAIESALHQSIPDLEVIVVDDGSSDNTPEIVAAYSDPRLRYLRQTNQGATAAFNAGVNACRGEYISILGSDDWYLADGLAPLLTEARAHPEDAVVAAGYLEVDDAGRVLREARSWEQYPSLSLETWLFWCPVLFQSALIRRDSINRVGGIRTQLQDWDLGLRLARAGYQMRWVHHLAFAYRLHPGQFIREAAVVRREWLSILDDFFEGPDLPPRIQAMKTDAYVHAYLKGSLRAFEAGDGDSGRADLQHAIELDPQLQYERSDRIYDLLVAWATSALTADPEAFLNTAFGNLPSAVRSLRKRRRYARAAVAMNGAFAAHAAGDNRRAVRGLLRGVCLQPDRLRNKGVLSIAVEGIIGRRLAEAGRVVARRFLPLESRAATH
jgi:glycosyltransferase involved in cell wall biosynthesis